jgi:hypothetical protein
MAHHEEIFISVHRGRAFVSRYVSESDGSFSWESAVNATELEQAAMRAIIAQGGTSSSSGTFPCPPELAAQAQWPSDTETGA